MSGSSITITEQTLTPREREELAERRKDFARNSEWFEKHAIEIGRTYRGKHVVVSGGELVVGETFDEARELARDAHPEDKGDYFEYISAEQGPRLYAHLRHLAR
ncbi:MAG: hypothetical protein EXS09_08770 [Gemmataceae bacterium]|nr:hypothetical protein [Gemmataceae bacterium]